MRRALPHQYTVGDKSQGADFSPEEIDALVHKVALWFRDPKSERKYDDPLKVAKARIKECLLGKTTDGRNWYNCPQEFALRVKAKCAYDMETGEGSVASPPKAPRGRPKKVERSPEDKAEEKATSAALSKPASTMSPAEQEAFREKIERDILDAFPELDNPASLPNVRSLSMLYAQREVIDRELAIGMTVTKRDTVLKTLKVVEEMADTQLKRLGIHADQIRKRIADKASSSISELVGLIDDDKEFKDRERIWALQQALQLWWMTEHLNGRKDGPQLHPFELWHMTRTRPVEFKCRHGETYTVVEGFTPIELRDYLVSRGVLVEKSVVPHLVADEDLVGLETVTAIDIAAAKEEA